MSPKKHPYYPLFLDIENRHVLIVGGGSVAARKAETLLRYGAVVTVVSPESGSEIARSAADGHLTLRQKRFDESDLGAAALVFAATDDAAVNAQIAAACRTRGIPVNVADAPQLCDFIVPAIIEQGSIQVAVSTAGSSPALARKLKQDLQQVVGSEYAELSSILGVLRERAKAALPTDGDRKRFFDRIITGGVLELLRGGNRAEAYSMVRRICGEAGVSDEGL